MPTLQLSGLSLTPEAIQRWTGWLWLLLTAVWLGYAPLSKPAAYRAPLQQRLRYGAPLALGLYLLFVRHAFPRGWPTFDRQLLPVTIPIALAGLALVVAGTGWSIWARMVLDGNWSGAVTLKERHTLTRSGPYGITRHPIYTGFLVALAGSALVHCQLRGAIGLVLCGIGIWIKTSLEESVMLQRFGDEYRQYRREVPALFPLRFHS